MQRLGGVGPEVSKLIEDFNSDNNIERSADAMQEYARTIGGFGKELEAISNAGSDIDRMQAYRDLASSLDEARKAGVLIRGDVVSALQNVIDKGAEVETSIAAMTAELDGTSIVADELAEKRPFDETVDSAAKAKREIDSAAFAMELRVEL